MLPPVHKGVSSQNSETDLRKLGFLRVLVWNPPKADPEISNEHRLPRNLFSRKLCKGMVV